MSTDVTTMSGAMTETVSYGARSAIAAVGGSALLVALSPELSVAVLAIVPPLGAFAIVYGRYVRKLQSAVQERLAAANTIAEERINSIRTVRAFGAEQLEIDAYSEQARLAIQNDALRQPIRSLYSIYSERARPVIQ